MINLHHDDNIIISDLDEIPDPFTIQKIKSGIIHIDFNILQMDLYYYNLHTIHNKKWNQSKILTFNKYKQQSCCHDILINCTGPIIPFGGWYLSYFGDERFIKNKISTIAHQEYNNDYFTNIDFISKKIKNCEWLFDNNQPLYYIPLNNNKYLPYQYEIYLSNFVHK